MREVVSLDEWLDALGDAEVECTTPCGAVSYLGALSIREWLEIGCETFPEHTSILWVDCGADTGACLASIREELPHITFRGENAIYIKLKDMAGQAGLIMRKIGED